MKKLRYALEAALIYILFGIFKILPAETASNLGGFFGRTIGTKLAMNRRVRTHLSIAFPDISDRRQSEITSAMWDNLGRIVAEYPHLEAISKHHTHIENIDILEPYFKDKTPIIFIGGHIGNWEINGAAMLTQVNKPISLTYRPPNNPWVAKLLDNLRTLNGRIKAYPKSSEGGRGLMKTLKEKGQLGILIDQKYNEGLLTEFFGAPAMTNPIFSQLALKYGCPIIPVRCERIKGINFKLTVHPPIPVTDSGGNTLSVNEIVQNAQNVIQTWIEETPEQWIWLHRRWKKTQKTRSKRVKN